MNVDESMVQNIKQSPYQNVGVKSAVKLGRKYLSLAQNGQSLKYGKKKFCIIYP